MIEIIPKTVFNYLPFSAEPLSQWNDKTDLLLFLSALFDKPGLIISANGISTPVNYQNYSLNIYERGQKSFQIWVKRFLIAAQETNPAPGAVSQTIKIPRFSEENSFGRVAKYIIAWDGVITEILSESEFFSIGHILESETDLICSLHLAANLYYKQALQVLRSFLEDLVLPIYLCDNYDKFIVWKLNDYRVPTLRGRNGILKDLVNRQILTGEIADKISDLYRALSSCIHGTENRLIHKGIYTGRWMGQTFKYDEFCEWTNYLSHSVDLGIHLLRTNISQWQNIRNSCKVLCYICHNDKDFDTEKYEFGGKWYIRYYCRQCGNEMSFTAHEDGEKDK